MGYLLARAKRILLPLYGIGLLLLLPPQFYFEMYSNAGYRGGLWELALEYFARLGQFTLEWPGGIVPLPFSGHLWFLQYLIVISLIGLPIMRYLNSEKGKMYLERLASWCRRRGGIFIFLIPSILLRIATRSVFFGEHSWADFVEFLFFFLIGFILPVDENFTEAIKEHGWICLCLAVLSSGLQAYFVLALGYNYPAGESFSLSYVLFECIMGVGRLSWMIFVFSLGTRYLTSPGAILRYANEAVLPFYLLHQTFILVVGWFVIRWDLGVMTKYVIISLSSFALIGLIYEGLIRRYNIIRILFGMNALVSAKPATSRATG
jgi:hypothetical protein